METWLVIACFHGMQGLGDAKMSGESPSVKLPNKEFPGGPSGNEEVIMVEEKPLLRSVTIDCSRWVRSI